MLLSFVIAWLFYVFGYILSPMAQQIIVAHNESGGLVRASKIMFWSAAASLIAGIVAAGGASEKQYAVSASSISISLLILVILTSAISASIFFFPSR